MRLKKGIIRDDGMIFWRYDRGEECWLLPEVYAVRLEKKREKNAAWREANYERTRASDAARRKANPGRANARSAAWKKANPAKVRAASAAWRESNPEKARAWRTANPAKVRAASAAWAKANPEKLNLMGARYRARKLAAIPPDANTAFVAGFYVIAQRLSKCLGIIHEVDHIVPLSMGGSHCHRNLQVIPEFWNMRKQNRYDYPLPDCYRTDGWMIV